MVVYYLFKIDNISKEMIVISDVLLYGDLLLFVV